MQSLSSPTSDEDSLRTARLVPIGDIMPTLLARYDLEWSVDQSVVVGGGLNMNRPHDEATVVRQAVSLWKP